MVEFEHGGRKHTFVNVIEQMVLEKVRTRISTESGMCKCVKCFYDVCAIVLNNIGDVRYVTTAEGGLMLKVPLEMGIAEGSTFMVEITKAIALVKNRPNH